MSNTVFSPAAAATTAAPSPWLWFAAGVVGAAALGAGAATVYLGQRGAEAAPAPANPVALSAPAAPAASAPVALAAAPAVVSQQHPVSKPKKASASVHTAQTAPKKVAEEWPMEVAEARPQRAPAVRTEAPSVPALCVQCGTVTAVTPVANEGKPSGVGAVAGAVLGGLLGNQFGGGDGKTLATIGGVLGGAYAGNTVEKRMHQQTTYRVQVRMDDGSSRSLEQTSPSVGVGSRVRVQGEVLSPLSLPEGQGA